MVLSLSKWVRASERCVVDFVWRRNPRKYSVAAEKYSSKMVTEIDSLLIIMLSTAVAFIFIFSCLMGCGLVFGWLMPSPIFSPGECRLEWVFHFPNSFQIGSQCQLRMGLRCARLQLRLRASKRHATAVSTRQVTINISFQWWRKLIPLMLSMCKLWRNHFLPNRPLSFPNPRSTTPPPSYNEAVQEIPLTK